MSPPDDGWRAGSRTLPTDASDNLELPRDASSVDEVLEDEPPGYVPLAGARRRYRELTAKVDREEARLARLMATREAILDVEVERYAAQINAAGWRVVVHDSSWDVETGDGPTTVSDLLTGEPLAVGDADEVLEDQWRDGWWHVDGVIRAVLDALRGSEP